MSYLTQMAGLAYHNFTSAAVGIALAIAFIRGIAPRESKTIGNFWVDMTRSALWVLLPACIVYALFLVSQGVVQNFRPYDTAKLVEPQRFPRPAPTARPLRRQLRSRPLRRDRWPRRKRSRCSAPMAAASSTPTAPSLRESHAAQQFSANALHFRHRLRADLHLGPHDRFAASRLGSLGRHGFFVPQRCNHRVLV